MVNKKITLILEVDPVRGIWVKVNQEVDCNPSPRTKSSVTIAKNMDIKNPSVQNWKKKGGEKERGIR
jgi:hypothetical protein